MAEPEVSVVCQGSCLTAVLRGWQHEGRRVLGEPGPKRHRPCGGRAASKEEEGIIGPTVRKLAQGAEALQV